jgi:tetratricopeptide (TPR) repeat protein
MPNLTSLQSAVRSQLLILTAGVFSLVTSPVVGQSVTAAQSHQQEAQKVLDEGVQAFKNGQYDEATLDFQRAKQLDPKLMNASLYLATTYASRYIPGARSEENTKHGQDAVEEFKSVLILDPQNISAIDGLGSMLFQWPAILLSLTYSPNRSPITKGTSIFDQTIQNPITGPE